MAQDAATLLVRIEATTMQLRKELAAADRAVSGSSSKIDKELGLVDKAFARMGLNAEQSRKAIGSAMAGITAAAAGGVAGLGALVVSTANSAREIQNLSQVANASTTEFQRYAVGAKTVGVEQEKLADILKDVNDRVGDFLTTGGGEMKDFFENIAPRIGVTAEQFRKLSGPQSLQLFYNSLEKANLSQAEMTFYMESMADETTALIPLLRDGGAGFSAMADEAERLGLVMSEKTLKQFDQFNAQMDTAKMAAGGFGTQIATEALPALSELNGLLIDFAQDSEAASVIGDALGVVLKGVATVAIGLSTTFANLGRAIGGLAAAASAAASMEFAQASSIIDQFTADNEAATAQAEQRIKKLWTGEYADAGKRAVEVNRTVSESSVQLGAAAKKSADDQKKAIDEKLKSLDALVAKYDPAAKAQAAYDAGIKLADEALKNNTYTTEQYQKVVQGLYTDLNKPIWDKHNKAADKAAAAIKKIDDQLQSVRDRLDPAGKAARDFADEQDFLKKAVDEGRLSLEEYNKLLPLLGKEYEENTRATSDWAKWTEGALDRVDGAFADAWRNIGDGFSSFRDSLTNAFKQMLAELAHMAITKPIIMQIGAAMGIGGGAGQAVSMMGGTAGSGGLDAFSLLKNGYSIANSGFGQAVMGGWNSGQGVWGGLQNAASSGWQYGSSALGSMFGSGGSGVMVDGVYQLGANTMPATVDLIGNTVSQGGNIIGTASGATTTATTWGSAATGLGSIMGGLSGAYMGYQNSGAKGAVAGGLGGWGGGTLGTMAGTAAAAALSGTAMGAAIGSILPGIGTVIGAALGAAFGSKLFGGAWETKDAGLAFSVDGGDFDAQQFEYQKKKGGLFSSDKKRTRFSDLDEATAAQFQGAFDATGDTVASIFETLSLTVEESSLAGLQMAREKISTKGKTEEEIQEAISEWFLSLGNSMTAELNKVFATGLDYDLAGMQAFVGNLQGVNEVLRYLDVSMYDMTVAGGKLAESLSAASGGLDALATNSQTYYGAFFTEAEKIEDTVDSIKRAFESADVELVGSREAYRAMVEDIDLTTQAGQEMFATMMALSGQAAQYYSIVEQQAALVEQQTASAYAAAVNAAQGAFNGLQQSINAEIQAAQSGINELSQLANSLESTLKSMRMESDAFDRMRRQQAQAQLSSALAMARAGGSLQGVDLSDSLSELGRANTDLFGSFEDYARDYWRTAHDINELNGLTDEQLSAEQQIVSNLELILDSAQREMDILTGISSGVMSVADALGNFKQQLGVAQGTPKTNSQSAASAYVEVLGRTGDAAGLAYWTDKLNKGMTAAEMKAQMAMDAFYSNSDSAISESKKNAGAYLGIPGFASGGFHLGGARIVGEDGPELEVTGPSRIYNASQTAAMLGGGDSARALASLQQSVERQGDALRSIAKHTMQTAKRVEFLERWDYDGLPTERDVA